MDTTNEQTTADTATTVKSEDIEISELKLELERQIQMRKDTQASFTKGQQELARLKAEREATKTVPTLSEEESERLDNLKVTDPDAWYHEKVKLDVSRNEHISSYIQEAENKTAYDLELTNRMHMLNAFNSERQTNGLEPLTEDLIAVDNIPPRLTKALENGSIDYVTFLEEVTAFAVAPKTVAKQSTMNDPSFSNANGGVVPNKATKADDNVVML